MSLIDLMLGLVVLVVGVGAALGSISSFALLEETNRETIAAHLAVRQAVEAMQAENFQQVFALYNDDDADDPVGVEIPSANFDVPGLSALADDPDGRVGRIEFPVDAGGRLMESQTLPGFGLPCDLNADGDQIDDASADHVALPVRLVVEWRGKAGNRTYELQTLLTAR